VPEAEPPSSVNAAYSRLGLVRDERSKLNSMTRQREVPRARAAR
jgi:hypothetical protein